MIVGAALFGALGSVFARAEPVGFAQPATLSASRFIPQDCFGALPLLPDALSAFDQPVGSLGDDAVLLAARTDMDRLAAPHDGADEAVANDSGPIEIRITRIFARFDGSDGVTYAAAHASKPTDLAARRWTPVVSQALVAWAYPAH